MAEAYLRECPRPLPAMPRREGEGEKFGDSFKEELGIEEGYPADLTTIHDAWLHRFRQFSSARPAFRQISPFAGFIEHALLCFFRRFDSCGGFGSNFGWKLCDGLHIPEFLRELPSHGLPFSHPDWMAGIFFRDRPLAPHIEHDCLRADSETKKVMVRLIQSDVIELERPICPERRRFNLNPETCNEHGCS